MNAWIYLNEDEPKNTAYNTPGSSWQRLIQEGVYGATDVLLVCFMNTVPTGPATVPVGDGSSFTLAPTAGTHPDGLTNLDYLQFLVRDARKANPGIRILVTLDYGGDTLSRIFGPGGGTDAQKAAAFASNLVAFLKYYDLDGFDIDWERDLSIGTTPEQFRLVLDAIGAQFRAQTGRGFLLTISPASFDNMDAGAVNRNVAFVNLQLYSGFTSPGDFPGVDPSLFAYGAKFETEGGNGGYQTAQDAFEKNNGPRGYGFNNYTAWRLNSDNFVFEQTQQVALHALVFPSVGTVGQPFSDEAPPGQLPTALTVGAGDVVDSLQVAYGSTVAPRHGGPGGDKTTVTLAPGEHVTRVSGRIGDYFGARHVATLIIQTNRRTLPAMGSGRNVANAQDFDLGARPGFAVASFFGRTYRHTDGSEYLSGLGVRYAKL